MDDVSLAAEQVTADGQLLFGGLLLGRDTPYGNVQLTGWEDLPDLDSGTALRSGAHGAWPGALYARTRTITWDFWMHPGRETFAAAVADLQRAATVRQDETPLIVRSAGRTLMVRARVLRRALPVDRDFHRGIPQGSVQWEAADPRRYGLTEESESTSLPQPEAGLDWGTGGEGLDWTSGAGGLDWGESGSTGNMTATNRGDADAHPVITFRGPVTTPSLTRLEDGAVLEYDLALGAADTLTVDTWAGTVLLNGSASRLYTATARSVPEQLFTIPPGATSLAFRNGAGSVDPAATATVRWREAHW